METDGQAAGGGESEKRTRTEGNSDGESATTEEISEGDEITDDEQITELEDVTEEERARWAKIDRQIEWKVLSEEEEMDNYRQDWEFGYAHRFGSFDKETELSSMVSTYDTSVDAWAETALQVYSIKVEKAKLRWPLHVYGMVDIRDAVDHRRNILFNRKRDNCQIITKNDPYLLLTGPSRAIVFLDPAVFEINLKVKGESEDKEALIHQTYWCNGGSRLGVMSCSNKRCKINLSFMELEETVQATITSVQIIRGSWPRDYAGKVLCHDGSSHDELVLLDFRDGRNPPVDQDGNLDLSRRVVSVNVHNNMTVSVDASESRCAVVFTPEPGGLTESECDVDGHCRVKITVAWSLLVVLE
ncbi:uncharacterized protein LOC124668204 [Lolium rigidum]|uniref:uncharacterized protein LOC124668204 n=1 Tax=Lolium rigidum TaxID=89674 RepID=UPI001F5CEEFF|nr:uncharacterized protein LOC124668204 [Lolium rigidum]